MLRRVTRIINVERYIISLINYRARLSLSERRLFVLYRAREMTLGFFSQCTMQYQNNIYTRDMKRLTTHR